MNYYIISSLARIRGEEIRRDAALRRALRVRPAAGAWRLGIARAVRRVGRATINFGDALAGSR